MNTAKFWVNSNLPQSRFVITIAPNPAFHTAEESQSCAAALKQLSDVLRNYAYVVHDVGDLYISIE